MKSPGGTITRTLFDSFDNAVAIYVGTNDKGATDADPTGGGIRPNNMVLVTENEYDAGCCRGSGNLTQVTQWVDANTSRVTNYGYDWQNRRVVVEGEEGFYQKLYYDNLGNNIRTEQYDGGPTGNLIALSETAYDALGRVYQQTTYGVDPATGAIGNALTANTWYDLAGNVIKYQPAGATAFIKAVYDGAGRAIMGYAGFDADETAWADAFSVADDTILGQVEVLYDAADNLISVMKCSRVHTATDDQLGELQTLSGADPKARVSYMAYYYDGIGRQIALANYGTNGNTELARPDTVPTSSDTVLVNLQAFNDRGELYSATDPAGRKNQTQFDDAGHTLATISNYVTGTADPAMPDQDVTVLYSYTPDGKLATLTAVNGVTGNQVTQYVYGTALVDSSIARGISFGRQSTPIRTIRQSPWAMVSAASTTASSTPTIARARSLSRRTKTPRSTNLFTMAWAARRRIALRHWVTVSTGPFYASPRLTTFAACSKTLPATTMRRSALAML